MGDLDLRRLRHFLALADALNYGRAAAALRIAQPALSRSISAFERELGVRLFDRSRMGTRLTPAGEHLRQEARDVLRAAESLQRRVRVVDREGTRITIGFMPGNVLTPAVRHLEEHFPGIHVEMVRTSWTDQIAGLRDGRFDACIAHRPFDDEGLTAVDLWTEPSVAVLPVEHPAPEINEVALADLADRVRLPGDLAAVEERFEQVAAGYGIVVVPESAARYYRHPGLTYVRVRDLPPVQASLVVETRRRSAVLRELVVGARSCRSGIN